MDVLGNRLVVWGGYGEEPLADGAWLDLDTDVWSPLPSPSASFTSRYGAFFGVAGQRWVVWGGLNAELGFLANGALYDPKADAWANVAADAPAASSLSQETALVSAGPVAGPTVFGGSGSGGSPSNLGYGYDPGTEDWWKMPTAGAPSPRGAASLTWSPITSEFIVWGGHSGTGPLGDGARYAISGTWKAMSAVNAPSARSSPYAVMLGTKLVVFGGKSDGAVPTPTGGIYDVTTDSWEPLPLDDCAPPARSQATFTAFGDGKRALLWGGSAQPTSGEVPVEQGWLFAL